MSEGRDSPEGYKYAARIIAGLLAITGAPLAADLIYEASSGLRLTAFMVLALFALAYLALVLTALGMRVVGHPFTTWIFCIAAGICLLGLLNPWRGFYPATVFGTYVNAYIWAVILGGALALFFEIMFMLTRDPEKPISK
jgi:hypothetical protein